MSCLGNELQPRHYTSSFLGPSTALALHARWSHSLSRRVAGAGLSSGTAQVEPGEPDKEHQEWPHTLAGLALSAILLIGTSPGDVVWGRQCTVYRGGKNPFTSKVLKVHSLYRRGAQAQRKLPRATQLGAEPVFSDFWIIKVTSLQDATSQWRLWSQGSWE